ncbi:37627_t:CDS:2, partial [Gigaspora margarita]
ELEQKNTKLEARLAILEQASLVEDSQTQNGKEAIPEVRLSIDNSVSAVDLSNSIVDQQNNTDTKSMEGVPKVSDKEIDNFIPEEPIPKVSSVNLPQPCQRYPKSLEENEIDSFLDSENKKMVSNLMRERNREKKLRTQEPPAMPPTSSKEESSTFEASSMEHSANVVSNPRFPKKHTNTNECQKVIGVTKSNAHVTKSSEVSISIPITQVTNSSGAVTSSLHEITPSLPLSHTSNSENKISENNKSLPKTDPEKEILIRNESDIDALILLLQQKFKMSKKILDKWKADIVFEFRDNTKYWKEERESMPEADFLKHKKDFEAKMGVPTTPHKKELKNKSLALIEYG